MTTLLMTLTSLGLAGQDATITPDQSLDEYNLDGRTLTLVLYTDTFVDASLDKSQFSLNGPSGLSISSVTYDTDTSAFISLQWIYNDFDVDFTNFTLTIPGSELKGGSPLSSDPITINAVIEPKATIGNGGAFCSGGSRNLTIDFEYTSAVSYTFRYTRDGGSEQEITTSDDPYILSVSTAGTYALSYLHADGIDGETYGSATVTVNPLPTPNISGGSTDICAYTDPETYTTSNVSGHTYQWQVSGGTIDGSSTGSSVDVIWTQSGSRSIQVTETITSTGCSATDVQSVNVKEIPPAPVISGNPEFCDGSSTQLTATPSVSINSTRWNTGATGSTLNVSNTGNYAAQVKSALYSNCWSRFSPDYPVTENPLPQAILTLNKSQICEGETATLTVTFTQGNGPFNIQYKENGTTRTLSGLAGPSYEITVNPSVTTTYQLSYISDDNGCVGSKVGSDPVLTVNPKPTISFNPDPTEYLNTDDPVQFTASATPTGGTGVFSGSSAAISSSGLFTPASAIIGINTVTYTYTTTQGCVNNKSVDISVFKAAGEIVGPKAYDNGVDHFIYCFDGESDTIIGNAFNAAAGAPTFFSGPGITDIGNNKAVFDPSLAGSGDHVISYNYYVQYLPNIPILASLTAEFRVDALGSVNIAGLDNSYCVNNDSVLLQVAGAILNDGLPGFDGTETFSGSGVSGPFLGSYFFDPQKAGAGNKKVTYTYTRTFSQCQLIREKSLVVHSLPQLDFNVSSQCILTGPEPDSVQFLNYSPSAPSMVLWSWNFGDPISGDKNTSNLEQPWHDYNSTGSKIVRLTGTDNNGCVNDIFRSIDFGERSLALFEWEKECFGDSLEIVADDDGGRILSYKWDFGEGSAFDDTTKQELKYMYGAPGNYDVKLRVLNDFGCLDSSVRTIPIRPTVILSLDNPYFQDFESGDGGWVSGDGALAPGINSWFLGPLQGTLISDPAAGNAWVTNPSGFYQNNEKSYVEGPCFDFSAVQKPMIRFKYWVNTENTRDGSVLQSSIDDGNSWQVVGSNLDGVNWYNSALLTGEPGGQRLGWTGTTQTGWREARNLLDNLKGERVRLRIAFGADAVASDYEGFAFDDVWIGERTRMALLEHFTNANAANAAAAEADINPIANANPTEVIDIHYHTAFPQADDANLFYPAGPSSRTLYYGVSQIPYSVMDGTLTYSGFDASNDYNWNESHLFREVLLDPMVDILLDGSTVKDNQLQARVRISPRVPEVMTQNLTLHLAVLENEQGGAESVLKKMLPDPGGTSLLGLWGADDTARVEVSWSFNPADYSTPDSLVLVAFVQRESTKRVYQAACLRFDDAGTGTAIEAPAAVNQDFGMYPNPSSGIVRLVFDGSFADPVRAEIYNELGMNVGQWKILPGSRSLELDLSSLSPGIYLVKVLNRDGLSVNRKLIRSY